MATALWRVRTTECSAARNARHDIGVGARDCAVDGAAGAAGVRGAGGQCGRCIALHVAGNKEAGARQAGGVQSAAADAARDAQLAAQQARARAGAARQPTALAGLLILLDALLAGKTGSRSARGRWGRVWPRAATGHGRGAAAERETW